LKQLVLVESQRKVATRKSFSPMWWKDQHTIDSYQRISQIVVGGLKISNVNLLSMQTG